MEKELMFEKLGIRTIDDYLKFAQNNIMYGWVDKSGNRYLGVNDAGSYSLQKPEDLIESKLGICWDLTELSRAFFESITNLNFETYYLFLDDGAGCPSHTFLVFYENDKVYWFEPMFNDNSLYFSGIHEFDSLETLLNKVIEVFLKNSILKGIIPEDYGLENIFLYKYTKPCYHINGFEMRNHINNSEKIGVTYDRKSI